MSKLKNMAKNEIVLHDPYCNALWGGVTPLSAKGFLAKWFSVKGVGGGGTPLTEKIRGVVFDSLPYLRIIKLTSFGDAFQITNYKNARQIAGTAAISFLENVWSCR